MPTLSLALYGLSAMGAIVLAAGYMVGDVPKPYHQEIFDQEGQEVTPGLKLILTALFRILGAGVLATAASIFVFAAQIDEGDPMLAKLRPLLVGLIVAVPASILPRRVEAATGVRTPWRAAVALTAVLLAAFATSIL